VGTLTKTEAYAVLNCSEDTLDDVLKQAYWTALLTLRNDMLKTNFVPILMRNKAKQMLRLAEAFETVYTGEISKNRSPLLQDIALEFPPKMELKWEHKQAYMSLSVLDLIRQVEAMQSRLKLAIAQSFDGEWMAAICLSLSQNELHFRATLHLVFKELSVEQSESDVKQSEVLSTAEILREFRLHKIEAKTLLEALSYLKNNTLLSDFFVREAERLKRASQLNYS
jgi:hypothetical protein